MKKTALFSLAAAFMAAVLAGCGTPPAPSLSVFTTAGSVDDGIARIKSDSRNHGLYYIIDADRNEAVFFGFDPAGQECAPCGRYADWQDVKERVTQGPLPFADIKPEALAFAAAARGSLPGGAPVVVLRAYHGDPGLNLEQDGIRSMIYTNPLAGVSCTYASDPAGPQDRTPAACFATDRLPAPVKDFVGNNGAADHPVPLRLTLRPPAPTFDGRL